ncbi:hypothetical protein ACSVW7_002781 [Escherichia coli]
MVLNVVFAGGFDCVRRS